MASKYNVIVLGKADYLGAKALAKKKGMSLGKEVKMFTNPLADRILIGDRWSHYDDFCQVKTLEPWWTSSLVVRPKGGKFSKSNGDMVHWGISIPKSAIPEDAFGVNNAALFIPDVTVLRRTKTKTFCEPLGWVRLLERMHTRLEGVLDNFQIVDEKSGMPQHNRLKEYDPEGECRRFLEWDGLAGIFGIVREFPEGRGGRVVTLCRLDDTYNAIGYVAGRKRARE